MEKNRYLIGLSSLIALFMSCSKTVTSNTVIETALKKIVFTRSNTDSVTTSFSYDANGRVVEIKEKGNNMVGFSPTFSSGDVSVTFQRDVNGRVTNYALNYPAVGTALVVPSSKGSVYYNFNSNKLYYSVGGFGNDSTFYTYFGGYVSTAITYHRLTKQPVYKQEFTFDTKGNLLTNKYSTWNGSTYILQESQTINVYEGHINAIQVLSHEESILALRPRYSSNYNSVSESYQYGAAGSISYIYSYSGGLAATSVATAASSNYNGTVKFYY